MYAKTGAGGLGFGPSYVMVTNISCTVMAILINLEALNFNQLDAGTVVLTQLSLLAVLLHFLVAVWLYLYAKLAQSQSGPRSVATLVIALVDALQAAVSILMVCAFVSSNCDTAGHLGETLVRREGKPTWVDLHCNDTSHPPTLHSGDDGVEIWHQFSWVWLLCICLGMIAQALLGAMQARQQAQKSLTDETLEDALESADVGQQVERMKQVIRQLHASKPFAPCSTACGVACVRRARCPATARLDEDLDRKLDEIVQMHIAQDASAGPARAISELRTVAHQDAHELAEKERQAFAALSFNTWLMIPALLGLKIPFSANLLSTDAEYSPFCRRYAFNTTWQANFLIALVTLCRAVCMMMCIYVEVSRWGISSGSPTWGALSRINVMTPLFSFQPKFEHYILVVTRLFMLQSVISFVAAFLWTNLLAALGFSRKHMTLATVLMLAFCLLDLAVMVSTGYYAACIRFPKSPIFECKHDFGRWIVDPQNQIQSGTFHHIAEGMIALYCCRLCLQTFMFWTRRSAPTSSDESDDQDPTDQAPLLTVVYNGIFHGVFILLSQYPLDLPNLLTGRWSILQQRPHWTNGLLQIVVLVEKTMMGYLILELASSNPNADHLKFPARAWIVNAFSTQAAIQFVAFFYQQVTRPGRNEKSVNIGDHVVYSRERESDALRMLSNGGRAMEVLEIRQQDPTATADDADTGTVLHASLQPIRSGVSVHSVSVLNSTEYKVELTTPDGQSVKTRWISAADVKKTESKSWRALVVLLAFLDWFHISFNLTNLINMLTNDRWHALSMHESSESGFSVDKEGVLEALCYLCIFIYGVRIVVQPILLLWRGAASTFSKYVYKVLTIPDLVLSALLVLAWVALPKEAADLGLTIPILLIGCISPVVALLGYCVVNRSNTGCLYKTCFYIHFVLGLVQFGTGGEMTLTRDQVKAHLPDSAQVWSDFAIWILLGCSLGNFLRMVCLEVLKRSRGADQEHAMVHNELTDATTMWNTDATWYSALTFNTYLMLPAMMLVENPYRDTGKTVSDSFIRLGKKGLIDYVAGFVLFLMVVKKSINAYLIVAWLNAAPKKDDTEAANVVSLTLLLMHFAATLYVMMVPKLAFSQRSNFHHHANRRCVLLACCRGAGTKATLTGIGLLTIALVDWISLIVNLVSLINWWNVKQTVPDFKALGCLTNDPPLPPDDIWCQPGCRKAPTIVWMAIFSMVCFILRVAGQLFVYLWLFTPGRGRLTRPQNHDRSAPNYDASFRPTMPDLHVSFNRVQGPGHDTQLLATSQLQVENQRAEQEEKMAEQRWQEWNHEWRVRRDLFQQLSFNSWMMIPALLFIEKPFHRNLLNKDHTSPFRRGHGAISTVYLFMLLKKIGVFYVNIETLTAHCGALHFGDSEYNFAKTAVIMSTLHTIIWLPTMFVQFMSCCSGDDDPSDDSDESDYDDDGAFLGHSARSYEPVHPLRLSSPTSPRLRPVPGSEPEPEPELALARARARARRASKTSV